MNDQQTVYTVKAGFHLLWPSSWTPRHRGGPGYRVDFRSPFEHEWCKDQGHKLEPCSEKDMLASPIDHTKALSMIREFNEKKENQARPGPKPSMVDDELARVARRKADGRGGEVQIPDDQSVKLADREPKPAAEEKKPKPVAAEVIGETVKGA